MHPGQLTNSDSKSAFLQEPLQLLEPHTLTEDLRILYGILNRYVELLRTAPRYPLADFLLNPPSRIYTALSEAQIVYLIETVVARPIYVGQTRDGTKEKAGADRLWSHAKGHNSSNVVALLREVRRDLSLPKDYLRDHYVRVMIISDPMLRRAVEVYATLILKPEAQSVPAKI